MEFRVSGRFKVQSLGFRVRESCMTPKYRMPLELRCSSTNVMQELWVTTMANIERPGLDSSQMGLDSPNIQ